MIRIEICLGSSCFARGGNRYPAVVAAWLVQRGLQADVRGRRCENACADGPTVLVDGVAHRVPDEQALRVLLEEALAPAR
jgi:NADH:ubiquinone oxidoreductase subunit E